MSKSTKKKCCVPMCPSLKTKSQNLSFHIFPAETETVLVTTKLGHKEVKYRRMEWIRLLGIREKVCRSINVCSLHFQESDFFKGGNRKKMNLKKTAVPSQLLPMHGGINFNSKNKLNTTVTCSVPNCGNTFRENLEFFYFPKNPERAKKWIENIDRQDLISKTTILYSMDNELLCERHFEKKYFIKYQKQLISSAVPTIYLPVGKILNCNENLESDVDLTENFIVYSATYEKNCDNKNENDLIPIAKFKINSSTKNIEENEIFWTKNEDSIGEDIIVIPDHLKNTTCCICLSEDNQHMISLDSTDNELHTDYNEMLRECSLEITEYDEFLTAICVHCSEQLVQFYCFTQIFKHSQKTLKQFAEYENQKNDVDYGIDLNCTRTKPPNIDNLMAEWAELQKKKPKKLRKNSKYNPKIFYVKEEDSEQNSRENFEENRRKIEKAVTNLGKELISETSSDNFDLNEMLILNVNKNQQEDSENQENFDNDRIDTSESILLNVLKSSFEMDHSYIKKKEEPVITIAREKGERINIYRWDDYKLIKIQKDNSHLEYLPSKNIPQFAQVVNGHIKVFECLECDKKFYSFNGRMKHVKNYHATKVRPYKYKKQHDLKRISDEEGHLCVVCGKKFELRHQYLRHVRRHKNIKHTCQICDRSITTMQGLKQHMTLHQNIRPYLCSTCGKSFRLKTSLRVHEKLHDENHPKLKCPICQRKWKSQSRLRYCIKTHSGAIEKHPCSICPKIFLTEQGLQKHSQKHINDQKEYKCQKCSKNIFGLDNFKKHLGSHNDNFEQKSRFVVRNLTEKSRKRSKGPQADDTTRPSHKSKCPYCVKSFLNWKIVNAHCVASHSNILEAQNEDDNLENETTINIRIPQSKSFSKNVSKEQNENTLFMPNEDAVGDGESNLECQNFEVNISQTFKTGIFEDNMNSENFEVLSEENQIFEKQQGNFEQQKTQNFYSETSNDSNLLVPNSFEIVQDASSIIEEKSRYPNIEDSHECASCGTFCGSLKNLLGHSKICFSKIFKCDNCSLTFDNPYTYVLHSEKHIEKNFLCKICAKKFPSLSNLKIHEKTHTLEKKFECNYCEKKFKFKQKLDEHYRTHSGEKNFSCHICQKKFALKKNLTVHERRHKNFKPYNCFECGQKFFDSNSRRKHCRQNHEGRGEFENPIMTDDISQFNVLVDTNT